MLILLFEIIWLLLNQATFFLLQISFSIHGEWILKWPIDTKIQTCSSTLYNAHNLPNWPIKIISNHLWLIIAEHTVNCYASPVRWHIPVILALWRLSQKDRKFEASLGYIARLWKKKRDEIWGGEIERTEEENENRKKGGKEKMEREKISKE